MTLSLEGTASKRLLDYIVNKEVNSFPCKCYHPGTTCWHRISTKSVLVILALLKINLPIHVIPLLIFKYKALKSKPLETIIRLVKNIAKSVAFLGTFVIIIFVMQCYAPRILPSSVSMNRINELACLLSGLGIVFEQPHKRVELTYYCIPRVIEALWLYLDKRGIHIPTQENILFAISMGILACCLDKNYIRGFTHKGLFCLWGTNQSEVEMVQKPLVKEPQPKLEEAEQKQQS